MKTKMLSALFVCMLALDAFWCDLGDDGNLIAFLVEVPKGVKDLDAYGQNICQFAMNYAQEHDLIQAYYAPEWKPKHKK